MKPLALFLTLLPVTALAQSTGGSAATVPVEMAPIECYWRTSVSAVRVGEPFTLILTCAVVETASTSVVVEQNRLDPGAVALQPFEVMDGELASELRTPTHRYFQYEYRLRYIGEEIGRDHALPALTINYRIRSRTQESGAATEGRERQYALPAHPLKVISLVTAGANDIREPAPPTFAAIADRRFTGSTLRVAAWVLYALGGLLAAFVIMRGVRRQQPAERRGPVASPAASLRAVARELDEVRAAKNVNGWDEALAARALGALRIAAAYESAQPVAQAPAVHGSATDGQIRVRGGWLRRRPVVVSAAATALSFNGHEHRLAEALRRFTAVTYGRGTEATDGAALDDALVDGTAAVSSLRRRHSWLASRARALAGRFRVGVDR